ncbi:hypothetical protein ONZ45_g9121 [Pleurotus djamor]|nr:hypothetical protein ONZ45_g9121 [Pleurotus djamor]
MGMDAHIRRGHPIVFGLLILFGIIELSISAWLTSRYSARHDYFSLTLRDRVRFTLFTSIWTVVFSIAYLVLFWHSATGSILTSVASHLIFLFLSWVFWTAAAASVTEVLGGGINCSNTAVNYCAQLNALLGFAWVEWILVTLAIVVVIIRGVSAARRGDGYRGPLVA